MLIEEFFNFVYSSRQAENQNVVAGFYLRITANQHTFTVANKSGNGHSFCQFQIFNRCFGNF